MTDDGEAIGGPVVPELDVREAFALHRTGAVTEARAAYEAILRRRPDNYDALNLIGLLDLQSGALEKARAAFEQAVGVRPEIASGHRNFAHALHQLGRPADALQRIDEALVLEPRNADALALRGRVLKKLGRLDEAMQSYRLALASSPDQASLHNRLGGVFNELRRFDQALDSFENAIRLRPDYAEAHMNRGHALTALDRAEEAVVSHDRALEIRPGFADALVNRAVALLSLGRFEQGWSDLEARKLRKKPVGALPPRAPPWAGKEDIAGRTLMILAEQGLGDTIQFCRYLSSLEARGARVLFAPQKRLTRLLAGLSPAIRLVDANEPGLSPDFQASLMSLPLAFGTDLETIPAQIPYLAAEPSRVTHWRARLGEGGFRIGIAWQGSRNPVDSGRSFPVSTFAGIAATPGVRLISLQKGDGIDQLDALPDGMTVEVPGPGFDAGDQAFVDTAAVIEVCDLVITSDTAVAHLAGALGRPTWVVLQHAPDWRWMRDRDDSPWYPTMRLFRQRSPDDWGSAFDAVEAALHDLLAARGLAPAPHAPVGWGELIDKVTILEIKRDRLGNAGALANVRTELAALDVIAAGAFEARPELEGHKRELAAVNCALWDIEDALRNKEAHQAFDDEFIALARAVYHRNDERALIKRAINTLLGSSIVEEKSYRPYGPGRTEQCRESGEKGE